MCERWRHAGLPCPQRAFSPKIIDSDGDDVGADSYDDTDDFPFRQLNSTCSLNSVSMNAVTEIGEVCAISRCPPHMDMDAQTSMDAQTGALHTVRPKWT